ncbi:hypothetical protein Tco_0347307 [Tanacetum coccineum]
MGHDDKIVLARIRTSTLDILIEDIQIEGLQEDTNFCQHQPCSSCHQVNSVTVVLPQLWKGQAATMANANNTNRNTGQRETPVARKCSYRVYELPTFHFNELWPVEFIRLPIGIEEAFKIPCCYANYGAKLLETHRNVFMGYLQEVLKEL